MKTVLFICVENAARSQMAEAFAKRYGGEKIEAMSAGTMPANQVNPLVVEVMREKKIDISENKPKIVNDEMVREADAIVVMGCSAEGFCPANLLGKVRDWQLDDPKGKSIEKVREIRDKIEALVLNLIQEIQ